MGNKQQKDTSGELNLNEAKSTQILSPAIESLKADWAKAQGVNASTISWEKTSITFAQFKKLMEDSWEEKELKNLFDLYDVDGSGTISWREYVCVVALIMSGDEGEKIKLLFLAFDDDGNGVLSYKEFLTAVKKFSQHLNKEEAETLVKKVFTACDTDGNKKVTYGEFQEWAKKNPKDIQQIMGNLNILAK